MQAQSTSRLAIAKIWCCDPKAKYRTSSFPLSISNLALILVCYRKTRIDNKKNKNTQIYMENPRQEKSRANKKNILLCQKLVQNGRILSDYYIKSLKTFAPYIYNMGEKINKGGKFIVFLHHIYCTTNFSSQTKKGNQSTNSLSLSLSLYIYIYIYMYVCMYVVVFFYFSLETKLFDLL